MSFSDRIGRLDRLQKSLGFRVVATAVVLALGLGVIGYVFLDAASAESGQVRSALLDRIAAAESLADDPDVLAEGQAGLLSEEIARLRSIEEAIAAARSPVSLSFGIGLVSAIILLFVWFGLGLTYAAVTFIVGLVAVPMMFFQSSAAFGYITMAGGQLVLSFAVLLRGSSILLSGSHPVLAIARNVLSEAVRMKLSLLFIAMLVLGLVFLPIVLNGEQPLRFRIQGFLQYATMITYGLVAMLVLFFGVATVAFEQRDKIIWQTMTKPVAAWQYVLGKWLGVVMLAAVLLLVSSAGVFLFTEGLRRTPAVGEVQAYEPMDDSQAMTEDRMIVETRVLTARRSVFPTLPFNAADERFDRAVEQRIADEQRQRAFNPTPADRVRFRGEAVQQASAEYRSIDPRNEGSEEFVFAGLIEAKRNNMPLTLQYKVDAEGNRPDAFYNLTFVFADGSIEGPRRTGLGFAHTMTVSPRYISDNGVLRFSLFNGALEAIPSGGIGLIGNTNSIVIPPDGLEISFQVGSFRGNFLRVQAVQWVKLAFLAMVAVCSATFLSFPVACLISVGVFFLAQSSGWVQGALPGWGTTTTTGEFDAFRFAIYHFSDFISGLFTVYNELQPTQRLSDGRLLSWGRVTNGVAVLGLIGVVVYAMGVYAFRSRQLAVYSGN